MIETKAIFTKKLDNLPQHDMITLDNRIQNIKRGGGIRAL